MHCDLFQYINIEGNLSFILSIMIILYVSQNYIIRKSLTANAISWNNLVFILVLYRVSCEIYFSKTNQCRRPLLDSLSINLTNLNITLVGFGFLLILVKNWPFIWWLWPEGRITHCGLVYCRTDAKGYLVGSNLGCIVLLY